MADTLEDILFTVNATAPELFAQEALVAADNLTVVLPPPLIGKTQGAPAGEGRRPDP